MTTYISLLRGINVSGHKPIGMEELRYLYKSLGFSNVQSYIQSGNVIFSSEESSISTLVTIIQKAINDSFGFEVVVIIRTKEELNKIIENTPYSKQDISKLHVTFLSDSPKSIPIEEMKNDIDTFLISGTEIYLFCPSGYGRTKLSNNFFEKKLKVNATTRNWKTVMKLFEMGNLESCNVYTSEELLKQCPKPEGEIGKYVGIKMNDRHLDLWRWGLGYITIKEDYSILDVGCGGGKAIRLLADYVPKGSVFGVDHSKTMVKLSEEINEDLIANNRVQICNATVHNLPFENSRFELVTAFETYGFWSDIINSFIEVRRVLKPGGQFLIVNSAYTEESFEERNNYWRKLINLNIHSTDELKSILLKSGFISISIFEKMEDNWILAIAVNPNPIKNDKM